MPITSLDRLDWNGRFLHLLRHGAPTYLPIAARRLHPGRFTVGQENGRAGEREHADEFHFVGGTFGILGEPSVPAPQLFRRI